MPAGPATPAGRWPSPPAICDGDRLPRHHRGQRLWQEVDLPQQRRRHLHRRREAGRASSTSAAAWASPSADFDDDGRLDLYFSNINSNQRWFGEDLTVKQYMPQRRPQPLAAGRTSTEYRAAPRSRRVRLARAGQADGQGKHPLPQPRRRHVRGVGRQPHRSCRVGVGRRLLRHGQRRRPGHLRG